MRLTTRRRLGGLLWLVGVGVAVAWSSVRAPADPAVLGLGRSVVVEVSALEEGRIASVEVDLHDPVGAGQVVVHIDPAPLQTAREVLAAELLALAGPSPDDLASELKAARDRSRRIEKRAELAAVDARLDRVRRLLDEGAASRTEVDELEARRRELIADLSREGPLEEDDSNAWSVVAAAKRLDALDARIAALDLRSVLDGQVSAVHRRAGEVVRRGEPVIQVRRTSTDEVIAWAPPQGFSSGGVAQGDPLTVVRADGSELAGSVVSVGSGPTLLPERTWRDPRREEWGVAFRVRLDDGAVLLPDEPVLIRL
ncbi:MAG: HlyD family efflux transporter periplasmic adaptor subunit [Myxococcota bacterium]